MRMLNPIESLNLIPKEVATAIESKISKKRASDSDSLTYMQEDGFDIQISVDVDASEIVLEIFKGDLWIRSTEKLTEDGYQYELSLGGKF